jgi:hypothetical protein
LHTDQTRNLVLTMSFNDIDTGMGVSSSTNQDRAWFARQVGFQIFLRPVIVKVVNESGFSRHGGKPMAIEIMEVSDVAILSGLSNYQACAGCKH